MPTITKAAIVPGRRASYLDHIIPLCSLLDIPLYLTDRSVYEIATFYYPEMAIKICEEAVDEVLGGCDVLLYVEPSRSPLNFFQFGHHAVNQSAKSICGLHGNSEKNSSEFWLERLADEETVLLYGDQMLDLLREKNILSRIPHVITTGNYRRLYYEANKKSLDALIPPFLKHKRRKRVLFAPTWTASDLSAPGRNDYSPFFEVVKPVLDEVPTHFEVVVKLHPFLFALFPEEIETIKLRYGHKENVFFLEEFPCIYPLLETIDLYLGDYSSVGYDFLYYDKPLFFFGENASKLHAVGRVIEPVDYPRLYQILDEKETHSSGNRQALYRYAFGEEKSLKTLKEEIENALL